MQIHDLNTKTLTNPAYVAFDDGTDTYKADFKSEIDNAAASAVADADLTDNTVAFTSGDAESPTTWTAVSVLTSGLTIKVLFNRISTMIKNVRYIWNLLGSSSFSNVASTLTGAIGNTALTTTAQTLSGAIAEHESDISALNSKTVATSQAITSFYDNRCENIAEAEKTFIMKFGSINIVVICVKMKTAVTSQQTSIFTLPSGYNPPANYQSYGVVCNRTTGKTYQAQVSSAGNVNIINRGELAVGDYLYGQIAWMA